MQVLRQFSDVRDPNLLVGAATADDAGVYRISRNRANIVRGCHRPNRSLHFAKNSSDAMRPASLRAIPAVEKLLQAIGKTDVPRPIIISVIRGGVSSLEIKEPNSGFLCADCANPRSPWLASTPANSAGH
jgi:hypothetical protein